MKWTTLLDELQLTDYPFGRRVKKKIADYKKYSEETLPALQEQLSEPIDDDLKEELTGQVQVVKDAIADLNTQLCGDMRRTNSNKDNKDRIQSNLKKTATKKSDNVTNATNATEGKEPVEGQAAVAQTATVTTDQASQAPVIDIKTAGAPPSSNGTATAAKPAVPPPAKQATPPSSSPTATTTKPPAATKKSSTGLAIFFSSLAAMALGFFVGRSAK